MPIDPHLRRKVKLKAPPVTPGVVFEPRSYQGLQRGINQIVDAVRPTLGPQPRAVAVENTFRDRLPEVLDTAGVIARRIIQLPDRDADMGAMLVRQLLWHLHEEVGDATATAAVVFQDVYNQGLRYVVAGGNPMRLREYLEDGVRVVCDELDRLTIHVEGKERLAQLAESLCFDAPLARLLGEIFDIVGAEGEVEVKRGQGRGLERQYIEGMYWRSGIASPHMLKDQEKLRTDLTEVAILISDFDIDDPRQLAGALEMAIGAKIRTLLVVANKFGESSMALLLGASREPERFQVIAAKTPGKGPVEQAAALEDLAILTGGRPLLQAAGETLRGVAAKDLGHARRVWVDRLHLGIMGGKGDPRHLRTHIAGLRAALRTADQGPRRTTLEQRIGKLMGGSAILTVGGAAEVEVKAREELARRTARLLRAALREGVLPGGGLALLACRRRLRALLEASSDPDEQAAYRILIHALEEPFRTIVANAGYEPGEVMAQLLQSGDGLGFDIRCGRVVNMTEAGIFDVAGAQKAAIRGAVSGAATALTVEVLVHKRNPESSAGRP